MVRIPEEVKERLNILAEYTHRPKSYFVRQALLGFLDEYETLYKTVADYRRDKAAGTLKLYTLEEIKERHGLNDIEEDKDDLDAENFTSI